MECSWAEVLAVAGRPRRLHHRLGLTGGFLDLAWGQETDMAVDPKDRGLPRVVPELE